MRILNTFVPLLVMRHFIFIFLIFISVNSFAQQASVIKITDLEKRILNPSDTTYIVNFWDTWYAPCIKELPDFENINRDYKYKKIKVLLVSLDFKEDLKTKLLPFMLNKNIASEVLLLDEVNGNYFIPKVADQWTGAIPATLIVNNKNNVKHFFEKKVTYELLKSEIESVK